MPSDPFSNDSESPYLPPTSGTEPTADETLEIQEYRAAVGSNSDYYLATWGLLLDTDGRPADFNWGALLFSGLWLPYRKMYRLATIYFVLVVSWAFFEELMIVRLWQIELSGWLYSLIRFIPPIICGVCANQWYYRHVGRIVAAARAEEPDPDSRLLLLHERGGASLLSACAMFLLFFIMVALALMVIELFAPTADALPA